MRRLLTTSQNGLFKILFMGRDLFSCSVMKQLHAAPDLWKHLAIVTQPDQHVGRRGSELSISPLKLLGESLNLPVHTMPSSKAEFRQWKLPSPFSDEHPSPPQNHLIVTASFGRILPASFLDLFLPQRRLNVHPSLLPAYRGPAPIQHAIMNGEKETGVCIIQMLKRKEGIDAGAVYGTSKLKMPEDIDFANLRDTLALEGGTLLVSVLRDMLAGQGEPTAQTTAEHVPSAPAYHKQ
ncbi:formyl transferase [Amanita rubescens]|nr:formyl transferase [Amanita rubescens]